MLHFIHQWTEWSIQSLFIRFEGPQTHAAFVFTCQQYQNWNVGHVGTLDMGKTFLLNLNTETSKYVASFVNC